MSNYIEVAPAETLEEYRALLERWRAADGTATSSGIDESERSLAAKEVEAVSGALRSSPFGLDAQGKLVQRKMSNYIEHLIGSTTETNVPEITIGNEHVTIHP